MQATSADPDARASACRTSSTRRSGRRCPRACAGAAALWGLAQRCAMTYPDAVRRAGHADGDALFDAILEGRSGVDLHRSTSTRTTSATSRHPDKRIALEIPELLEELRGLADAQPGLHERRVPGRALRPASGAPTPPTTSSATRAGASATPTGRCASARRTRGASGLADGGRARDHDRARQRRGDGRGRATRCSPATRRFRTATASTSPMPTAARACAGVAPNALTSSEWRDAFAGTPWHKHVPARIEPLVA